MSQDSKKTDITISVDPQVATVTLGLLRGFSQSIVEQLQMMVEPANLKIDDHFQDEMKEVLDEIYEKCIEHTDIRKYAANMMELLNLTKGVLPKDKKC